MKKYDVFVIFSLIVDQISFKNNFVFTGNLTSFTLKMFPLLLFPNPILMSNTVFISFAFIGKGYTSYLLKQHSVVSEQMLMYVLMCFVYSTPHLFAQFQMEDETPC